MQDRVRKSVIFCDKEVKIFRSIDISVSSANSRLKWGSFLDIPRADVSDTVEARDPGRRLLGGGVGARSCPPSAMPRRYKGSSTPSGGGRTGSHSRKVCTGFKTWQKFEISGFVC